MSFEKLNPVLKLLKYSRLEYFSTVMLKKEKKNLELFNQHTRIRVPLAVKVL